MADVIRKVTVEKGFDPRDFVLFAFGGAGPAHAGVFAAELGVKKVIVPQRKAASTWCAFGAAAADVLHIFEHTEIMQTPVDASRVNRIISSLEDKGQAADGGGRHRRRPPALRVLARRAPPRPDQRSRDPAAVGPRSRAIRGRAAQAVRRPLREALRPRLGAGRRAARDRGLPPARARADAAAEAAQREEPFESHSRRRASRKPRTIQWSAAKKTPVVRRRQAGPRQRHQGAGDRRDFRHHAWWCIRARGCRSMRSATSRSRSRRGTMETCIVETGLFKKKPCGQRGGHEVRHLRAAALRAARRGAADGRAEEDRRLHVQGVRRRRRSSTTRTRPSTRKRSRTRT